MFVQNVGIYVQVHMVSQPRRVTSFMKVVHHGKYYCLFDLPADVKPFLQKIG
jgi:hypothetical protein